MFRGHDGIAILLHANIHEHMFRKHPGRGHCEHMFREHMFREHAKPSICVCCHEPILHPKSKSVRLAQPACEHDTNMARTCLEHEMMHEASLRFRLFDSYTI